MFIFALSKHIKLYYMDNEERFQQMLSFHKRIRWAGLSKDPEFVQNCQEVVEQNSVRIEKLLNRIDKYKVLFDYLQEKKDDFFPVLSDESIKFSSDFQAITQDLICYFCECVDIQSNFILLEKDTLIALSHAEVALLYRHAQVDVVRAFQMLKDIDSHIRKNDNIFSVEMIRRECHKYKGDLDKKYGIYQGPLRDQRNKVAAHWDIKSYIDYFEMSKKINRIQIIELCDDMINLTKKYLDCMRTALDNYLKKVDAQLPPNT